MELAFVETRELIDELLGRYDYAIFAGLKVDSDSIDECEMRWKGSWHSLMGLMYHTQYVLARDLEDISAQRAMDQELEDDEDWDDDLDLFNPGSN